MKKPRYEIEFIFGEPKARVVQTATQGEMFINLDEPVTEQNFERIFKELAEAMYMSGKAHKGDEILCVTFPEGTTRHYSKGKA
ncbi:MAG TPA: hypothetical protein VHV29_10330 [Terriglobales bacterium]|jgi:hypothetical protein|nr:hypothetical protein [Terriglobales bacterium]